MTQDELLKQLYDFTLVGNADFQSARSPRYSQPDLLAGIVTVSVYHRVHHAFPHRYPDLVLIVLIEAHFLSFLENNLLRGVHGACDGGRRPHLWFVVSPAPTRQPAARKLLPQA